MLARPWLLLTISLLLLAIGLAAVVLLANQTTGFGGADYSGARPAFVLVAISLVGVGLSIYGLLRRR